MALTVLSSFLLGCSSMPSLPSYHEMSCVELKEKEKSLQSDYKFNTAGSILDDIVDAVDDTAKSTADATQSEVELEATKRDLREVQGVLHQKRCK